MNDMKKILANQNLSNNLMKINLSNILANDIYENLRMTIKRKLDINNLEKW